MIQPEVCSNFSCSSNYSYDVPFFELNPEGFYVCVVCGTIDRSVRIFDERPPFEKKDPYAKKWGPSKRTDGVVTRGRYKEKFHYNERVSQWLMADPPIPYHDWSRIEKEAYTGKYGAIEEFSRASIIRLTRALSLQKYRERWKSILKKLNYKFYSPTPPSEFLEWAEMIFPKLVSTFYTLRHSMPKSVVRSKDGSVVTRLRHNFLSYNYIQRKLLEIYGCWDWHYEFPVPRSHNKLHALDDVFELICYELGLKFQLPLPFLT
jgi:hypothetical protein